MLPSASHIIAHIARVGRLRYVLLLEAFTRQLLGARLMVSTHLTCALETFRGAGLCRHASCARHALSAARGARSHGHTRSSLSSGAALSTTSNHANARRRLELLDGLTIANTCARVGAGTSHARLRLLIGTTRSRLLLVNVCAGVNSARLSTNILRRTVSLYLLLSLNGA